MKDWRLLFTTMFMVLMLSACRSAETAESDAEMREYKTDAGETIEIPEDPQRIVVMATSYFGNFMQLDANMAGAISFIGLIAPHIARLLFKVDRQA